MLREAAARVLKKSGLLAGARMLARGGKPVFLTVLTYHRVLRAPDLRFDPGVMDRTADDFDKDVRLLCRAGTLIGLAELHQFLRGAPLPPHPVLITFDDGYKDNLEIAAPILRRHGARGVFFLATDYLEERRLFWWDKVHYLVHRARCDTISLTYPIEKVLFVRTPEERAQATTVLLRTIKDWHGLSLTRLIAGLEAQVGVPTGWEQELADPLLMTWDDVRKLRELGMDVGSHTASHRVLQTVPEAELSRELCGSREKLERELSEPVLSVSYPVGKPLQLFPHIACAVRDAGYKLGFSNGTGPAPLFRFDALDIPRVAMGMEMSHTLLEGGVAFPPLLS